MKNKEPLTVSQLIDLLNKFDGSLIVWADGCDCSNEVVDIEPDTDYYGKKIVSLKVKDF